MSIESQRALESKNLRILLKEKNNYLSIAPLGDDGVHDGKDLFDGLCTEEGNAGLFEVIEAFENRGCGKMPTGMDNAFSLVVAAPLNGSQNMFF